MKQDEIKKHSMTQSIILHLLPGILVGTFYFLALEPGAKWDIPQFLLILEDYHSIDSNRWTIP